MLAIVNLMWIPDNSAYDIFDCHDYLLAREAVPATLCNSQNTTYSLAIKYKIEDDIDKHSEDMQMQELTLYEPYTRRIRWSDPMRQ